MDKDLKRFVEKLARTELSLSACNQYSYEDPHNEYRRNNLLRYLKALRAKNPKVLLVGEAPGYRGTRRTGVPFSSERLIMDGGILSGHELGFELPPTTEKPIAEMSAGVVWRTLHAHQFYPLIWASFPFHPHFEGKPDTNRAPSKEELKIGAEFLKEIMMLFPGTEVVAIGRVAEKTLKDLGFDPHHIRHPSHGGATMFAKGIADFAKKYQT